MRRWGTFLIGVAFGAALLYAVLNFHIINASDGLHLVPKVESQLAGTFVDIRSFGPREWLEHPEVFIALQRADRGDLLNTAADDAMRKGLDRLLGPRDEKR